MTAKQYDHKRWNKLLEDTIGEINKLATLKGGEYAGDYDRLANFRRNGERLGLPMEVIWAVYAGKHWDAITQFVSDLNSGKERTRAEPMQGRVHDLIVYSLLFLAMLDERDEAIAQEKAFGPRQVFDAQPPAPTRR